MNACFLAAFVLLSSSTATDGQKPSCGRTQAEGQLRDRIIGGHPTTIDSWPWLARISLFDTTQSPSSWGTCSGSILSHRHVLTTAHCFVRNKTVLPFETHGRVAVMAGTDDPGNVTLSPNGWEYFDWVANVSFPPRRYYFSDNDNSGDIAVIELDKPLNFSARIQPICLAREFREAVGEVGHIVGFGSHEVDNGTGELGYSDDGRLRENIVIFHSFEHCKLQLDRNNVAKKKHNNITARITHPEDMICAGGVRRNVWFGDSGGPLMVNRNGAWYQVGTPVYLTTTYDSKGRHELESCFYNRITSHCDWIANATRNDARCVEFDE